MHELRLKNVEGGIVITVKVVPGSSKTAAAGILDGMLKMKVAAAPEKGKANKALVDFLARKLGIRKNDIEIISGQTSPVKQLRLAGITTRTLKDRLQQ